MGVHKLWRARPVQLGLIGADCEPKPLAREGASLRLLVDVGKVRRRVVIIAALLRIWLNDLYLGSDAWGSSHIHVEKRPRGKKPPGQKVLNSVICSLFLWGLQLRHIIG